MAAKLDVAQALKEVKRNLTVIFLFDSLINSIMVFLVFAILLSLFGLTFVYALIISAVYFFYSIREKLSTNKIRLVEKKYGNINEKLRTAAEFRNSKNRVVQELHWETLEELKKVEQSSFISQKKIYTKSIVIILLSFLVFLLSPFNLSTLDVDLNVFDRQTEQQAGVAVEGGQGQSLIRFSEEDGASVEKASEEIYGTATVAKLGDEEIRIKIRPAGTELSIQEVHAPDLPDFSGSYPKEISAVAAASYEESIGREDLEMVKRYFNNLADK